MTDGAARVLEVDSRPDLHGLQYGNLAAMRILYTPTNVDARSSCNRPRYFFRRGPTT